MSDYIDCPKCQKKYHFKAEVCPTCKITPQQHQEQQAKAQQLAAQKQKKKAARELARQTYCTACGSRFETAKRVTRGSLGIEVLLWLCILLPGIIYSLWRLTTRHNACPVCRSVDIIPATSPRAKQLIKAA